MPHNYVQDVKKTINALSRDEGLILEEKLILLGMINDHVTAVEEARMFPADTMMARAINTPDMEWEVTAR